jgi:hypothetical protein
MLFYCALNLSRLASGLGQEIAAQLFKVRDACPCRRGCLFHIQGNLQILPQLTSFLYVYD